MSSILGNDISVILPNFTLVTASAGSGKTHTLTLRYLQLLLSPRIPNNNLNNILAITFTNNAAAEMKARILEYLKSASLGIKRKELEGLQESLAFDEEMFRTRAEICLETILDHYSDFQVQTIDSFIIRLLKASAVEFGFNPTFDVSFGLAPLVEEALDHIMREIGKNERIRNAVDEVVKQLEEHRQGDAGYLWNPIAHLSRRLVDVIVRLNSYRGLPVVEDWSTKKNEAGNNVLKRILEIETVASRAGCTLTSNYAKIVAAAKQGDTEQLIEKSLGQKAIIKSKGPAFDRAMEQIAVLQEAMEADVAAYVEAKARMYYLPMIMMYRLLKQWMETLQKRRGELSLSDANRILATQIGEERIPEIYFSLGERIFHYLIDEFQDTAPIQWSALRPLIENSLAQRGSLFLVGDTKQSIYTFRGADWQIMKRMLEAEEFPSVRCERKQLQINWRSSEAVVHFVNHVFQEIIPKSVAGGPAALSGLTSFVQEVKPKGVGTGYVEVHVCEQGEEMHGRAGEHLPEQERVYTIIHDCIQRGYSAGDIAILTPKNEHVIEISRWLNSAGLKFMSHSSLDIRTRKITGEFLSLLQFLDSPVDDLAFASFILGDTYRAVAGEDLAAGALREFMTESRFGDRSFAPLYTLFRVRFEKLWNNHFEKLFTLVGYLPVYDLMAELYSTFDVFRCKPEEEATLVKLAEVIKEFENRGSNSLKDFLLFSEERDEEGVWNIDKSTGEDAITVMTVHKSKGLGFPVVINLFYDGIGKSDPLSVEEGGETLRLLRTTKSHAEKSSMLSPYYQQHLVRKKVDELNKLYVALTRASEEMYILCMKGERGDEPSSLLPADGFTLE